MLPGQIRRGAAAKHVTGHGSHSPFKSSRRAGRPPGGSALRSRAGTRGQDTGWKGFSQPTPPLFPSTSQGRGKRARPGPLYRFSSHLYETENGKVHSAGPAFPGPERLCKAKSGGFSPPPAVTIVLPLHPAAPVGGRMRCPHGRPVPPGDSAGPFPAGLSRKMPPERRIRRRIHHIGQAVPRHQAR